MSTELNETRILAERAEVEREIAGRTLCDLLEDNARRYPDAPAASWRQGEEWATLTWRELHERVVATATGLASLGVGRGDVVALMMSNRPEHLIADQAAVYLGAIPTTFYSTLAPEQIRYCAAHSGARSPSWRTASWPSAGRRCVRTCPHWNISCCPAPGTLARTSPAWRRACSAGTS
jgi:long-subunit acyl-CoA synthetase (AMP-forming)